MIKLSQSGRQARIDTPLGEDVLMLQNFSGSESISRGFEYTAVVLSEDPSVDGNAIVGKPVTATYFEEDGHERVFNGFVSRFEYSEQVEQPVEMTSYTLTIVPWMWFLNHNRNCQIFQEKKTPDIIKQVFQNLGFNDFQLKLTADYPTREYCVQYRESDFDFVSRLMEEEGIFYYYEHSKGKHTLIICDDVSGYFDLGESEVRYTPIGQGQFKQLNSWRHVYEFRPGKVAQKDFNFKKPTDGLETEEKSRIKFVGSSNLEIYEYPGLYEEGGKGNRLTKVRMEEIEAEHDRVEGAGSYATFTPGGKFSIDEHSRSGDNGKSFVLTEVFTEFSSNLGFSEVGDSDFSNEFRCIPAETIFRPQRTTPKPVVEGPQTAIVATDGQEIVVDEHARVKVQFHWDRYGKKDVNSSCWIRVSQHHAGKGWGMIDIPRQDEEVIVSFLEGDPDRPIITGRVYNGDNQPPYPMKGAGDNTKNKTRRGNKTKSYGGGGYNEMTMDDTAGQEQIRIHGQYNMDTTVQNDQTLTVNNNRTKTIAVDETNDIGNNRSTTVGVDHTENVGSNQTITVGANQSTTVAASQSLSVGSSQSTSVASSQTNSVGMMQNEMIGIMANQMVGAAKTVSVGAALNTAVGLSSTEQVGLMKNTIVGGTYSISAAAKFEVTCGASKLSMDAGGNITISGTAINISASGPVKINGAIIDLN